MKVLVRQDHIRVAAGSKGPRATRMWTSRPSSRDRLFWGALVQGHTLGCCSVVWTLNTQSPVVPCLQAWELS